MISQSDKRSSVITILLLKHRLQFGNFGKVDSPPLFVLGHDAVRFAWQNTLALESGSLTFC